MNNIIENFIINLRKEDIIKFANKNHLKTTDKEIDFVCNKQGEKIYVQVTYLLASQETIDREFGAYDRIKDNFPKYVVSLDEFNMSQNGIKHRNIRDFLLTNEWN